MSKISDGESGTGPALIRSPFDENDRHFRLAVKRVVADVLDRVRQEVLDGEDALTAIEYTAREIRNEDAV